MFKNRRIAVTVSIFAVGVVFGIVLRSYDTLYFRAAFAAIAAVSAVFCLFSARSERSDLIKRISAAAFAVAAFSFGVLRVSFDNSVSKSFIRFSGKSDSAEFIVTDVSSSAIDVRVKSSGLALGEGETVRLYLDEIPNDIVVGDRVVADVKYRYNDKIYLRSSGISLTASGKCTEIIPGDSLLCRLRRSVSESSREMYEDFEYAPAIAESVVIGDRSEMDSYIMSVYNNAGISHVLAISGLHLSVIAMSVYGFLLSLSVDRRVCAVFGFLSVLVYTVLVGFSAGTIRAAVMISLLLLSRVFIRRSDSFTSLFLALALLLIINPYSLASAGLQLSFLCSIGIMLAEPYISFLNMFFIKRRHSSRGLASAFYKLTPALITPAIVTLSASVFSFPVLFLSFDTVSYLSPLTNILAVPLFTLGLKFALAAALIYTISPALGCIIAKPAGYLFDFVTDTAERLYQYNIGSVSMHSPFMFVPAILSVSVIAVLLFCSKRKKKNAVVLTVLFCISLPVCGLYNSFRLSDKAIIEYGTTNSEYVCFYSQNKSIYIDLGGYSADTGAVFENGCSSLDEYIVVSYDDFTLRRFKYAGSAMKISRVYLPNPSTVEETVIYSEIKELCNRRKCDIIDYRNEIRTAAGDSTVKLAGLNGDPSRETLISINVSGKNVSLFGNGFARAVSSDIAVMFDTYNGEYLKLVADRIYAPAKIVGQSSNVLRHCSTFSDRLRIEFDISESEYSIYEP